jgi:hypothetical protein
MLASAGKPAYDVVEALPWHLDHIAQHMRAADREEVWASGRWSPPSALRASAALSSMIRVGTVDGVPACVFGVSPASLLLGKGTPWLLGTDLVEAHAVAFLRRNKPVVAEMLARYPYLSNRVDARNIQSIRWLKWLGFTFYPAEPFGPDGRAFHLFDMRAP